MHFAQAANVAGARSCHNVVRSSSAESEDLPGRDWLYKSLSEYLIGALRLTSLVSRVARACQIAAQGKATGPRPRSSVFSTESEGGLLAGTRHGDANYGWSD